MGRDTYGESGVGPPFRPALAFHQSPQEAPETTPSCITSMATLTDAALLPQPPTRRICKPPSHTYIPSEAALATSSTFPGSPFRGGAAQPPGGAYNSGAFNSGIFSSSVLHSSGAYNSGPFGHPARSSTGELYNSVALKKGVLVEFRGGSMETSEPSTRIGAARTALLPRSHGLGGTVYSADKQAGSRNRDSAAHNSSARRLRKSTTAPPPRASTDAKPAHKGGAFSRLSSAVAAAARARCACMGLGPPRAHKE